MAKFAAEIGAKGALTRPKQNFKTLSKKLAIFEYDNMGNRLNTREPDLIPFETIPNSLNQYSRVAGSTWSYDSNGNLSEDTLKKFSYDFTDKLQEMTCKNPNDHGPVRYYRDALGRVVVEQSEETIFRIYDGNSPVLDISSDNNKEFTFGNVPDRLIHIAFGNEDYWTVQDGLGSLRFVSDSRGKPKSIPSYRPFGAPEDDELKSSPVSIGLGGMWFTPGIFIYHTDFRSYLPYVGRFMQRDPLGFPNDINLYIYSNNNPISNYDPRGLVASESEDSFSNYQLGSYKCELRLSDYMDWMIPASNFDEWLDYISSPQGWFDYYNEIIDARSGLRRGDLPGGPFDEIARKEEITRENELVFAVDSLGGGSVMTTRQARKEKMAIRYQQDLKFLTATSNPIGGLTNINLLLKGLNYEERLTRVILAGQIGDFVLSYGNRYAQGKKGSLPASDQGIHSLRQSHWDMRPVILKGALGVQNLFYVRDRLAVQENNRLDLLPPQLGNFRGIYVGRDNPVIKQGFL